jgi:hypothetical protein
MAGYPKLAEAVESLRGGMDCSIEEAALIEATSRNAFVSFLHAEIPGLSIRWHCFENDLESANWNVTHRDHKRAPAEQLAHLQLNRKLHAIYSIPDGAIPIPIRRIEQP